MVASKSEDRGVRSRRGHSTPSCANNSALLSTLAFAAASGRSSEVPMSSSRVVAELSFSLTRQARILRLKIVDDGLEVDSDAGCQPNHGCVDLPILVGACCSEAFPWASPDARAFGGASTRTPGSSCTRCLPRRRVCRGAARKALSSGPRCGDMSRTRQNPSSWRFRRA